MCGLEGLFGVQRPLLPGCFRLSVLVGLVVAALAGDTGDGGGDEVAEGGVYPRRDPQRRRWCRASGSRITAASVPDGWERRAVKLPGSQAELLSGESGEDVPGPVWGGVAVSQGAAIGQAFGHRDVSLAHFVEVGNRVEEPGGGAAAEDLTDSVVPAA